MNPLLRIAVIFLIFSVAAAAPKKKTIAYLQGEYFTVKNKSGLYLREKPEQKSKALTLMPYQALVKQIKITPNAEIIDGHKNYWIELEYGKFKGFAFGEFLSSEVPYLTAQNPSKNLELRLMAPAGSCSCDKLGGGMDVFPNQCRLEIFDLKKKTIVRKFEVGEKQTCDKAPWYHAVDWYNDKEIIIYHGAGDDGYFTGVYQLFDIHTGKTREILSYVEGGCAYGADMVAVFKLDNKAYFYDDATKGEYLVIQKEFASLNPKAKNCGGPYGEENCTCVIDYGKLQKVNLSPKRFEKIEIDIRAQPYVIFNGIAYVYRQF